MHIFGDHTHTYLWRVRTRLTSNQLSPRIKLGLCSIAGKLRQYVVDTASRNRERNLIHRAGIWHHDHVVACHTAKHGDFVANCFWRWIVGTHYQTVWHDTKTAQIFECILRWLSLKFMACIDMWYIHHMHIQAVFAADARCKLTNCLDEAQALVITDRTAYFYEVHIATSTRFFYRVLDSVRQMRHQLHCLAAKFAGALVFYQLA